MSDHYDRNGKPMDLMTWAREFQKGNRHIGLTIIMNRTLEPEGVRVSTVWLGLDHSFGEGPPLIFETMVFGGEHDQYTERYSTEAQARQGHKRIVAAVRRGEEPEGGIPTDLGPVLDEAKDADP